MPIIYPGLRLDYKVAIHPIEEVFKGLLTLGVESLKIMALINGGAAVAILAYLGNIASLTPPPAHMPHMRSALLLYAAGVLATALAFIGAYATQLRLYNEERARHDGKPFREYHRIGVGICIALLFLSAVAFGLGCYFAASAFA
jgi:heme A synthase